MVLPICCAGSSTTIRMPNSEAAKLTAMTKQRIEALGQATLNEHGLPDRRVRAVREEDDTGDPEDDIGGRYGCVFYDERLILVNMRYSDDPMLVREILLHEITHALRGKREGDPHGDEFRRKLREIGGGRLVAPTAASPSLSVDEIESS